MSAKKSITPRKQKSRSGLRRELARDIASILANPETPSMLYNAIGDCLSEFEAVDSSVWTEASTIERNLDKYARFEEARTKGGAS
jgi:hypothetical protein